MTSHKTRIKIKGTCTIKNKLRPPGTKTAKPEEKDILRPFPLFNSPANTVDPKQSPRQHRLQTHHSDVAWTQDWREPSDRQAALPFRAAIHDLSGMGPLHQRLGPFARKTRITNGFSGGRQIVREGGHAHSASARNSLVPSQERTDPVGRREETTQTRAHAHMHTNPALLIVARLLYCGTSLRAQRGAMIHKSRLWAEGMQKQSRHTIIRGASAWLRGTASCRSSTLLASLSPRTNPAHQALGIFSRSSDINRRIWENKSKGNSIGLQTSSATAARRREGVRRSLTPSNAAETCLPLVPRTLMLGACWRDIG